MTLLILTHTNCIVVHSTDMSVPLPNLPGFPVVRISLLFPPLISLPPVLYQGCAFTSQAVFNVEAIVHTFGHEPCIGSRPKRSTVTSQSPTVADAGSRNAFKGSPWWNCPASVLEGKPVKTALAQSLFFASGSRVRYLEGKHWYWAKRARTLIGCACVWLLDMVSRKNAASGVAFILVDFMWELIPE